MLLSKFGALSLACMLAQAEAWAADQIVTAVVENDSIFKGDGRFNDGHYTHGMLLSSLWERSQDPLWLRNIGEVLPAYSKSSGHRELRSEFALGQSMFTPANISSAEPDPNDRPYAGWLYLSLGVLGLGSSNSDPFESIQDRVAFSLGIVGSSSRAGNVQTWWHQSVLNIPVARGWDTQLKNEPTLQVFAERSWRTEAAQHFGISTQWVPHAGIALGNVFDYVNLGGTVRIGYSLTKDFGVPRLQPSLPGSGYFERGQSAYLYAGFDGRAVARNLFLDGNTFRDSPSVDKRIFVGDLQVGAVVVVWRLRFSLTQVWRSKEFKTQRRADSFTAASISALF